MSFEEAAEALRAMRVQSGVMVHLLDAGDGALKGVSTEDRRDRPWDNTVSYQNLPLFRPWEELRETGETVNITRTYTNPINGTQSIAFYNALTLWEGALLL